MCLIDIFTTIMAQISRLFVYLVLPLLITCLMLPLTISTPTYLYSVCSNDTIFTSNSQYQTNLNNLFHSLSSNATTNNIGFYITSIANGTSDAVFGLFLCRGDQNISSCSDCVKTATTTDLPQKYCPNGKIAVTWYDECMVRYSNESLFGKMVAEPAFSLINTQNGTGSRFGNNVADTLSSLGDDAANDSSGKKFATKVVMYSGSLKGFYGLAQCTPDLTISDCKICLKIATDQVPIALGSRVNQPSCNVHYETYPFFYRGAANYNDLPPPPSFSPFPPDAAISPKPETKDSSATGVSNKRRKGMTHIMLFVVVPTSMVALILLLYGFWSRMYKRKGTEALKVELEDIRSVESLQYNLSTIRTATRNFSADSKLGEGGFGEVYKGKLDGGQDIAIKRLSANSVQGVAEFKTEVVLVAKLQHKNLVKLLGFCVDSSENILVYEFLSNSSLDRLLFDPAKKASLEWQTRYKIILGVARGLLYLHEDSRLKVIHRDLKPSNILLDEAMNPKISDFGLAKLFCADETQGDTRRIVGTYGYMAPEYAITGHYSVKSDVYSFGVIMLEIVSGQRNRFFGRKQLEEALLHRAWRLWNEQKALDLVDPTLMNKFPVEEVVKCIHVGLLCVQEEAFNRPRMTTIVGALTGQSISIPMPKLPLFFGSNNTTDEDHQYNAPVVYSGTEIITDVYSRE